MWVSPLLLSALHLKSCKIILKKRGDSQLIEASECDYIDDSSLTYSTILTIYMVSVCQISS